MGNYFTFEEVNGVESIFEKIYLDYKNITFYLDCVEDDSLGFLFEDILNCLYQQLTLLVKVLSNNLFDEDDDYE